MDTGYVVVSVLAANAMIVAVVFLARARSTSRSEELAGELVPQGDADAPVVDLDDAITIDVTDGVRRNVSSR